VDQDEARKEPHNLPNFDNPEFGSGIKTIDAAGTSHPTFEIEHSSDGSCCNGTEVGNIQGTVLGPIALKL